MNRATLIGFGEAGQAFAVGDGWQAFDLDPVRTRAATLAEAVEGAELVISVVTADQALAAAEAAAGLIAAGTLFCDMNSVAPGTKQGAAQMIEAAGGRYVDVAVMSPVNPARHKTPLLISGPHAADALMMLTSAGFANARIVGDAVGRASTIKMLRSVMYKGMEALTAECLLACEIAGVTDEVLASFGDDWASGADYRFDRMLTHGLRRAAEMSESCETLNALGIAPILTEGTVGWQQALGEMAIQPVPEALTAKLQAILDRMP
jgi:3-hydroxyisobutyrate dehydrogenase-like beta-hydroxyacid dehydrogenase